MPRRRGTPTLLDRALLLAVAEAERDGAAWLDQGPGTLGAETNDDRLLVARAREIAGRTGIHAPVRRALDDRRLLWPAAAAIGLLAGLSAAWAGLAGGGDPTSVHGSDLNVLWFLQVTLGVHTLFLVAAIAAMAVALRGVRHPLARIARAGAAALARAVESGGRGSPGARAAAAVAFGGKRGALLAGALGHTMGLGFIAGCVIALLTAASFREQYRFFWKSTLLTGGQATALIDALASGPRAVGFPSPTAMEIASARAGVSGAGEEGASGDTSRWVWLLVGALLVWGAAPRTAALVASLAAASLASVRASLPISESYRQRALARARQPGARPASPHDGALRSGGLSPPPPAHDDRPLGAPAVLAYEIDADGAWPPRELSRCEDLGLVDGASDRRRALERLDAAATRPSAILAFFSRGETPAEAERRFIADLVARAGERTAVALTLSRALSTDRAARDAERIAQRTTLWRDAAERAGVNPSRIVEIDLHHLTDATESRLRSLVREPGTRPTTISTAEILGALDDVESWARGTDHGERSLALLLQTTESRFGGDPGWRRAARSIVSAGDLEQARSVVAETARSIARILPAWMPRHPGWMSAAAALATTGTLAAVAIAGGPIGVAAGAWPLYAAAGAALGEMLGRGAGALTPSPPRDEDAAATGARAAVLHALVLGLQGFPDAEVAASIDRVLSDAPEVARAADVPALTAHVRARLPELRAGGEGAR